MSSLRFFVQNQIQNSNLVPLINTINSYRRSLSISLRKQSSPYEKCVYLQDLIKWLYYRQIPKTDEFHHSLNLSIYLLASDDLLRDFYIDDIMKQRHQTHLNKRKK
jgi:hypothetical protein